MSKTRGTAWDFPNESISPNGEAALEFKYLGEVAMGAPLSGECHLKTKNGKFRLDGQFGGPVVWNENSKMVAIPYWTQSWLQQMAIVDIEKMKMFVSEKSFRVLELGKFESHLIFGVDSPIHKTQEVEFDVSTEKCAFEIEIK